MTRVQTTLVLLYAYPAATLGPKNTTDAFVRTVCTPTLGVLHISIITTVYSATGTRSMCSCTKLHCCRDLGL